MISKNMKFAVLMTLAVLFFVPSFALASSDAHGGGNQLIDLGWRVLNFLIFAAILYFAAAKPIRNFLNGRIEGIKKELNDAEKGKEDAEKKLNDYMGRLAGLEGEIQEIQDTLIKEGEVERERIIEAAHEAAEKIKQQAAFSANQEMKKAVASIREEVAHAAVALAEKMLVKDLKKEDQKKLVSEYLQGLGDVN
ncbi:MAG: F0F1 ATP synthase subunit B [Deltaproteobacteria bacterium]|nr:F0F1 ATP synthase subunit B [Deltaproteobacteria bacterium]